MNALDVFSGIGGFALGFERVGIDTVAFCERERYCQAVLARRWPGVPCFPDVKEITADGLGRLGLIDIVSGGVPCQPASLAGSRRGRSDERWLWPAFLDIVRLSGAPWVLAENPLGLISLKPDGLAWVCGSLRELGYEPWPIIVSAHDVGAPHLRKRVWIVAHSNSNKLRLESRRRGGESGAGALQLGEHGAQESVADSEGISRRRRLREAESLIDWAVTADRGADLADSDSGRLEVERFAQHAAEQSSSGDLAYGCSAHGWRHWSNDPDAERVRLERIVQAGPAAQAVDRSRNGGDSARWWWRVEPHVGRVAHGIPARVDRIRTLGNAAIPQIVEAFGRAILEADRSMKT